MGNGDYTIMSMHAALVSALPPANNNKYKINALN